MCPATSTAPGNMTACAFPMGNGAGFRRDSEGTARWTTSSKSRAVLLWRPWKPSPEGLPSRRRPLCQRRRRKAQAPASAPGRPRQPGNDGLSQGPGH